MHESEKRNENGLCFFSIPGSSHMHLVIVHHHRLVSLTRLPGRGTRHPQVAPTPIARRGQQLQDKDEPLCPTKSPLEPQSSDYCGPAPKGRRFPSPGGEDLAVMRSFMTVIDAGYAISVSRPTLSPL